MSGCLRVFVCQKSDTKSFVLILMNRRLINLCQGISPIYEPGLEILLAKNIAAGRLQFTTSHQEGLKNAEIIIIAVGTPQRE